MLPPRHATVPQPDSYHPEGSCWLTANRFPIHTSVTAVGPDLYVNEQGRLWSFSTSQYAWTQLSGRSHPTDPLVTVSNDLYALSPDNLVDRMEVWKYDAGATVDANGVVIDRPWTKIAPVGTPPSARGGHSMAVDGTDLYVFGGGVGGVLDGQGNIYIYIYIYMHVYTYAYYIYI